MASICKFSIKLFISLATLALSYAKVALFNLKKSSLHFFVGKKQSEFSFFFFKKNEQSAEKQILMVFEIRIF
jgi:hypothetical protein